MPETIDPVEEEAATSLIAFARLKLKLDLYDWQEDAIEPFDDMSSRLVQTTLATPNGSGKSAVVIPALVLGVLALYPRARVVLTTADGKQLDGQVMPAIEAHRAKFPGWKFIEREVTTPTGGRFVAFTTDQAGRAEGWHKGDDLEAPLLIIADEAKTIPDDIFSALDRCTYNGLLLTSSPGPMSGRFYDSQYVTPGFRCIRVGLLDCPHITPDKIERIIAQHGADSPFTKSTLHGEFMEAEGEMRFDREGLAVLRQQCDAFEGGIVCTLQRSVSNRVIHMKDEAGWLWLDEGPMPGGEYLICCDPNTCEQGEGNSTRDNTACAVIRKGYVSEAGTIHPDHVVAALHWPGGVKWDSDVLASRMRLLADWYGDAMAVVEANNFGSALIKELQREGVKLWRRTRVDDKNPNKQLSLLGWLTTERTREHWVNACAKAVRLEMDGSLGLRCRYKPAVDELHTFVLTKDGRAEAQRGTHDDFVACLGIGLTVRCFNSMPKTFVGRVRQEQSRQTVTSAASRFGSCG